MGWRRQAITLNFTDSMRYILIFWKGFKQQSMINIHEWKMYLNRTDKMFRLVMHLKYGSWDDLRENKNFFEWGWGLSYGGFKLPWVKLRKKCHEGKPRKVNFGSSQQEFQFLGVDGRLYWKFSGKQFLLFTLFWVLCKAWTSTVWSIGAQAGIIIIPSQLLRKGIVTGPRRVLDDLFSISVHTWCYNTKKKAKLNISWICTLTYSHCCFMHIYNFHET